MKSGDDNFQSAHTHPEDGNCSVCNNVEQLWTFDSSYTPNTEFYIEHQPRKPENKNIKNKLSIGFYRHGNFHSQPSVCVCVRACERQQLFFKQRRQRKFVPHSRWTLPPWDVEWTWHCWSMITKVVKCRKWSSNNKTNIHIIVVVVDLPKVRNNCKGVTRHISWSSSISSAFFIWQNNFIVLLPAYKCAG